MKITENRVGEFASTIISHLLLLGHAQVGDLMQAYGVSHAQETIGPIATKLGVLGKGAAKERDGSTKSNRTVSVTQEKINQTLCELMNAGLVVAVHESDFRSEADNRTEAERSVGNLAEYKIKGKSKKQINALWEAEVREQLHSWKLGSRDERSEVDSFKVGIKRSLEDSEEHSAEKRQRLSTAMGKQTFSPIGGEGKLILNNLLKVWRYDSLY